MKFAHFFSVSIKQFFMSRFFLIRHQTMNRVCSVAVPQAYMLTGIGRRANISFGWGLKFWWLVLNISSSRGEREKKIHLYFKTCLVVEDIPRNCLRQIKIKKTSQLFRTTRLPFELCMFDGQYWTRAAKDISLNSFSRNFLSLRGTVVPRRTG